MNRKWAQTSRLTVVLAVALVASPAALGQSPGAGKTTDAAAAEAMAQQEQTSSAEQELGIVAIDRVAKADKYAFVFFFRANDERTQTMRAALESGVEEMPEKAEFIAVDVTDPLEKAIMNRFKVSRAPMPLILALAPNGAVTRGFTRNFNEKQLEQAFVSPCQAQCLKSLQEGKMVLVCIQNDQTVHNEEAMQGVNEFKADQLYTAQTAIVSVDPTDESEADFLKKLRVSPETEEAVTVLMAPPGRSIATFTGVTNKADIVAATKKAGSGCDPKSGCCPAPKKPAGKPAGGQKSGEKKP
ncbi:MAG: hypothetical protein ABIG44_12770 [Planctomycetota bacterium]